MPVITNRFGMSNIQRWFEAAAPRLISFLFHWLDDALKSSYGGFVGSLVTEESPFDELGRKTKHVIKRVLIMTFLLLLVRFVVPAPRVYAGASLLDTTTWIGILAFEGSCALGYIAIVPWLAKINMRALISVLSGGLRSELITFKPDGKIQSVEDFESKVENDMDDKAVAKIMVRPIVQGGLLLFGVIISMVVGVWLTPRWKFAVLCMLVYWLWSLFQSLMIPAALVYSDVVFGIHRQIKVSHEEIKDDCLRCQTASKASDVQGALKVVRTNKIGTGTWFLRVIWLFVWGIYIRYMEGKYVSTMWTWILLFVPLYLQVLLWISRTLQKKFKKNPVTS